MSNHHVVHVEFSAQDREAAGKFYRELFGWEIVQMPEMNGLLLSEKLLTIRSDLPIILSTGHSTPELENKVREIGVKQILKKPYSLSELLEKIK